MLFCCGFIIIPYQQVKQNEWKVDYTILIELSYFRIFLKFTKTVFFFLSFKITILQPVFLTCHEMHFTVIQKRNKNDKINMQKQNFY